MKKDYLTIVILIIVLICFGYFMFKDVEAPERVPRDFYISSPTPKAPPKVTPCYNEDGVEVECKG